MSRKTIRNASQEWRWEPEFPGPGNHLAVEVKTAPKPAEFYVIEQAEFTGEDQDALAMFAGSKMAGMLAGLSIQPNLRDQILSKGYPLTLQKLASSIDCGDIHTRSHSACTSAWCRRLAERLRFDRQEVEWITFAGSVHDVGKVVIAREILMKPAPLNEDEWRLMRRHPEYGAMIIQQSTALQRIIPYVQAHHERIDGSGYPRGLTGSEVPLGARIVSVADAFSTMTAGRIYKKALSPQEALNELKRCSGSQFDPEVVAALDDLLKEDARDEAQNQNRAGVLPGSS